MKSGISKIGRDELTRVIGHGRRFVRASDVSAALEVPRQAAVAKLAVWYRNGWLRRVRRDLYIPVPVDAGDPGSWSEDPLVVADEIWAPCYFTGWTAANHWGLTEQIFRTTVVKTIKRVRASSATALGHEYLLNHAATEDLEWGLDVIWVAERRIRMASPARTVADILDDPRLGGGIRHGAEILSAYLRENDASTLLDAADRLGNRAVFKRLGYLVSRTGGDRDLIEACRSRLSEGFSLLDPSAPARGPYARDWNLRVNISVDQEDAS